MNILIPTADGTGINSEIYGHFGGSPFYTIYSSETKEVKIINNSEKEHTHGQCSPIEVLQANKVDTVICMGMGRRAIMNLNELGIKVFVAQDAVSVKDAIDALNNGSVVEFSAEHACSGEGHHCH